MDPRFRFDKDYVVMNKFATENGLKWVLNFFSNYINIFQFSSFQVMFSLIT